MAMRRYLLATTACLAICGLAATARAQAVDVGMAIVFDASNSVGQTEFTRAIDAHVAFFRERPVADFLQRQGINSLAISAFSFGSAGTTNAVIRQLTPWGSINSTTPPTAFTDALEAVRVTGFVAGDRSPIGPAMWRALVGPPTNPPSSNLSGVVLSGINATPSFVALNQSGFAPSHIVLNLVSDGRDFRTTNQPVSASDIAFDLNDRFNAPGSSQSLNINAISDADSLAGIDEDILGPGPPGDVGILTGRTRSGAAAFRVDRFAVGTLSEAICRKFVRELASATPAAGASCDTLLAPTNTVFVPRTGRTTIEAERVVGRRAQVTDVAVAPGRDRSLTASIFLSSDPPIDTFISEVLNPDGSRTRTYDRLTIENYRDEFDVVLVVPLRVPLEYGALTRLGAALFGEMLENQPQRAQRLRGQVAPRGPAAVRGDGAPSTADQAQGGVFAAAGLNDSLRYTTSGQFATLPGFDFGWGEGQAGLDPAFTGSIGVWGRPFYSRARMQGGRGVDSYDHNHRGFAMGADVRIGRYGLVGVWGGGSSANVGFSGPGGGAPSSGSMSSWVGGVYGSAATGSLERGLWYADVTIGYGEQDWTLNRVTLAGAPARGEFRSPALGAHTEAGFAGQWGPLLWQPHLFLRTVRTERPALAETGTDAGVARQVDGARFTSVQAGPGLRLSHSVSLGDGLSLVPEGRIRWEREFGDNAASVSGAFVFDGARVPFAGRAPGLDRDALGLGASLKLVRPGAAGGGLGLDLDWDASVSNDTTAHRFALQLRYAW
jgi:outer membrane autotransporter protein